MSAENFKQHSETDWPRIGSITDEEIDTSDIPPLDDAFLTRAQWRVPEKKTAASLSYFFPVS